MANFVTVADVLSVAVEIERRGGDFYTDLAESSKEQAERDFFLMLAKEERRHEGVFLSMIKRIGGYIPENSEEYLAYVSDLLNSYKLFSKDRMEEARISPLGAAIGFEKDTLLFFHALEPLVPKAEFSVIAFCIEEEKKHIQRLMSFFSE